MERDPVKVRLFSPLVIIGALAISLVLFILLLVVIFGSKPPQEPAGDVTVVLAVIPAPTRTKTQEPTNDDNLPEPTIPVGDSDAQFHIGTFVKVSGTGGAGLRLREKPGLDAEQQFLGLEDEIFKIEQGPEQADGFIWWYLVAPFETGRRGWAAANYLDIVPEP